MRGKLVILLAALLLSLSPLSRAITLDECQRLAKENYPLLKQYGIIDDAARADVHEASRNYLPRVDVYGQATWQNHVTSFPESVEQLYSTLGIEMAGLGNDQYIVGIEANQLIWDGGETKARKQQVQSEAAVNRAKTDVELYKIVADVDELYFGILLYGEQLALNDELQRLLADNLAVMEAGVANGVAMESDVAAVKARLLDARRNRIAIEQNLEAKKRMLGIYVGRDLNAETFSIPEMAGLFPTDAGNRPEMAWYDARRNRLQVQKQAVNVSLMPQFGLFARGYYGNPGLDMFDAMFNDRWSFNFLVGVKFKWSIGEFYRKNDRLRKIELAHLGIDNEQEVFEFNMEIMTEQQKSMIESKKRQIEMDGEIVDLRRSVRQASEARLRDGVILVNDLLQDITDENNALIDKNIHEIELLYSIYKLKYMVNR